MEELYRKGKIRAIGVCNFSPERFVDLYMNCTIKPMINQIEYHPFFQQKDAHHLFQQYHCQTQAWGPLNEGQRQIFNHPILKDIAKKHHKTIAQIVLRWQIEQDIIVIPKTVHQERMIENMNIWDFQLDQDDFQQIAKLNLGHSEIIDYQCYKMCIRDSPRTVLHVKYKNYRMKHSFLYQLKFSFDYELFQPSVSLPRFYDNKRPVSPKHLKMKNSDECSKINPVGIHLSVKLLDTYHPV